MAEGKVYHSLRIARGGYEYEYLFESNKGTQKCYEGNRRCDQTREKVWMVAEVCQFSQGIWPAFCWFGEYTSNDRTRMASTGNIVQ